MNGTNSWESRSADKISRESKSADEISRESRSADEISRNLTRDTVDPRNYKTDYNLFGPANTTVMHIHKEIEQGAKWPFSEVIRMDLGDSQALGQPPISFIRQVLALVCLPHLIQDESFPLDVRRRATDLLAAILGSIGTYSDSGGAPIVRRHVADYVARRDGHPADYKDIFLTAGSTSAINMVLKMYLFRDDRNRAGACNGARSRTVRSGVMIPIPQYPLFTASVTQLNMYQIDYLLSEGKEWFIETEELERSISEASNHCHPSVIVVINPGNPTAHVLTRHNIEEIIKFAYKHNLAILADEVYQDNVYGEEIEFLSFKKALLEIGPPYDTGVELASIMSVSKGYAGECGIRGGYVEFTNVEDEMKVMFLKVTATECIPQLGVIALDCYVKPPTEDEESYDVYMREKNDILSSLSERVEVMHQALAHLPGVSCTPMRVAMFAFPKIEIPERAILEARQLKQCPSDFYTLQLFKKTGISVIPGSAFGQKPGTFHIRVSVLPQMDQIQSMAVAFRIFHQEFMDKYS